MVQNGWFENKTSHENESEVVWFRAQSEQIQQEKGWKNVNSLTWAASSGSRGPDTSLFFK